MPLMNKCLCINLRTATFVCFIYVVIAAASALLLRAIDMAAIGTTFEVSRGFNVPWRSHQWQAFAASDAIVSLTHVIMIFFSLYMLYNVTQLHFVLYMKTLVWYNYFFIMYTIIEFCFSVFEFSFYGLNTFRREFVVFIWLWWLFRTILNIVFAFVLHSRSQEIEENMASEIRSSDKKYVHSYSAF